MRIVLTGAAGALGHELRPALATLADAVVLTDMAEVTNLAGHETFVEADLADMAAVESLCEGADMIVHFGASADEASWDTILQSNIIGTYNVYEAAARAGARRVIYASSIHSVGMYPKTHTLGVDDPHRPDTFYGLSKCFAEDLARMYWEKKGLESVCLRIYSCQPEPANARALGSWLSYDDLRQLVSRSIDTPVVEFTIAWGVSDNDRVPVDNTAASHLGYRPKDNAESHAAEHLPHYPDPQDPMFARHGGPFAIVPLGESGVAMMKRMNEEAKKA